MKHRLYEILTSNDRTIRVVEYSERRAKSVVNAHLFDGSKVVLCIEVKPGE